MDFYSSELKGLNSQKELESKGGILVFGDSFTANTDGYVYELRKVYDSIPIINSAISGTGIRQHILFAPDRIEQFQPKHVVYQFYVGNDFMDISHPTNYSEASLIRNLYWTTANYFLFLHYINRKTAGLRASKSFNENIKQPEFSVKSYNQREQINFKVAPSHISDVIHLNEHQENNYLEWKDKFETIIDKAPKMSLIIVPHCAQVHKRYKANMESLGGVFNKDIFEIEYELFKKIKHNYPKVNIINPLKEFQLAEKNGQKLYYDNDPHLNPEGQRLLAKIVNQQLKLE